VCFSQPFLVVYFLKLLRKCVAQNAKLQKSVLRLQIFYSGWDFKIELTKYEQEKGECNLNG
jgi:hypothetical protein